MVRDHLSEELKGAGRQLLATTDMLDMQAQGAMWIYDHALHDWRYYLVTSLVDTIGRRKTYNLLLEAFESIDVPEAMTTEDVYLGSPTDDIFRLLSGVMSVSGNTWSEVTNCAFNYMIFDAVIYRSLSEPLSAQRTGRIEKRFAKRVRDITAQHIQRKAKIKA